MVVAGGRVLCPFLLVRLLPVPFTTVRPTHTFAGQLKVGMAEARRTAELAQQRSREAAEEAREPTSLAEVKYEVRARSWLSCRYIQCMCLGRRVPLPAVCFS